MAIPTSDLAGRIENAALLVAAWPGIFWKRGLSIGGRKSSRKNAIDMGLDVTLCRFSDFDTEAILKFSAASRQPWAFEAGAGARLKARARELGLPESILPAPYLGGTPVPFRRKSIPIGRLENGLRSGSRAN